MGTKKKIQKILLGLFVVVAFGCGTIKPAPPLIDSEMVYKLPQGVYTSQEGREFAVTEESPRWAVPEAQLFKAITEGESESLLDKYQDYIFFGILAIFFLTLAKRRP